MHVVFAGNPGLGKSTLLNTITKRKLFDAGPNLAVGRTRHLVSKDIDNVTYCDTPGLDDPHIRDQAALEISQALTESKKLKLIFVCGLEEGRVRPADVTTIDVILKAIEDLGLKVENKFSVIINKCNETEIQLLSEPNNLRELKQYYSTSREVSHIYPIPSYAPAQGESNVFLPNQEKHAAFVQSAPILDLTGKTVEVSVSRYMEVLARLMEELRRLRRELTRIQQERNNQWCTIA